MHKRHIIIMVIWRLRMLQEFKGYMCLLIYAKKSLTQGLFHALPLQH